MRERERIVELKILRTLMLSHELLGVSAPKRFQRRALRQLSLIDAVFKPQPEQIRVCVGVLVLLKPCEYLREHRVVIVLPRRAEDAVPVEIGPTPHVVGAEIRAEVVAAGAVPNDVCRALLLPLVYLGHGSNRSLRRSSPGRLSPCSVRCTAAIRPRRSSAFVDISELSHFLRIS